jgi:hypothetical protein
MALQFDGSTTVLTQASALVAAYPMSFNCWINPGVSSVTGRVMLIEDGTGANEFTLDVGSGTPRAFTKQAGTSAVASASVTVAVSTWAMITAVFASNISRIIYVNGVNKGSNTTSNTPSGVTMTVLGADAGLGTTFFNGVIAYPTIWNTALSPAECASLYNSGAGLDPRTIEPASLKSFSFLDGSPPYPDSVSAQNWTVTGTATEVSDPFTFPAVGSSQVTMILTGFGVAGAIVPAVPDPY